MLGPGSAPFGRWTAGTWSFILTTTFLDGLLSPAGEKPHTDTLGTSGACDGFLPRPPANVLTKQMFLISHWKAIVIMWLL